MKVPLLIDSTLTEEKLLIATEASMRGRTRMRSKEEAEAEVMKGDILILVDSRKRLKDLEEAHSKKVTKSLRGSQKMRSR